MTTLRSLTLSRRDREALVRASRAVAEHDMITQTEAFVLEAQITAGALSATLRRALIGFRRFGDASGGLLVRGVPLGRVPTTPGQVGSRDTTPKDAAAAMSVLLGCLGEQYGFRPEFGGQIIQEILPVSGFETEQISLGSTVDLECHVEMAFSPYRSDYVALLCLRQDHDRIAGTTVSPIDRILPLLDAATIAVLHEPRFRTKVDASSRAADTLPGDVWVDPISVLTGPVERPHLRVDFAETVGSDPIAGKALDALRDAARRARSVVRLGAGDLLVVDNHRALHGRTAFTPRYDGADRWLLRSFITKDLRLSENVRNADTRVVEVDFSENGGLGSGLASPELGQPIEHPVSAQLRSDEIDQVER